MWPGPASGALVAICIEIDEFCISNDEFCIEIDGFCISNDEFCIEIDGFCISNDEFCISNDGFCISNDEFCISNDEFECERPSRSTHDPTKPVKVLDGHGAVTVDVEIIDSRQQLISLAVDRVIKLWDMRSLVVSQTLSLDPANIFQQNIPFMLWDNHEGSDCLVAGCLRLARWEPAVADGPSLPRAKANESAVAEVPHSHRSPLISVRCDFNRRILISY